MSKKTTRGKTAEDVGEEPSVPEVPTPVVPPEEMKVQELTRRLTEVCMELIVKVATCRCDMKRQCAVYRKSQEIADLIDELQELRKRGSEGG